MTGPKPDAALAPSRGRVPACLSEIEALVAEVRWRLQAPPPAEGLTLTPAELDQIAAALGLGARPTAASILTAIDRLASVRIGDIRIPFTPGQLAELQYRAGKRGRSVEAEMQAVVARVEHELFYQGG
jgi:hypothetical protein